MKNSDTSSTTNLGNGFPGNLGKRLQMYLLPYPLLGCALVVMWIMLNGFTIGQVVMAILVAWIGSFAMRHLEPERIKIYSWRAIFLLCARVFADITTSNMATATIILRGGRGKARSGFIIIPLELKDRMGLAILGCVLTATPGTAWIAYDTRRSELLLHVLDLEDEEYWRQLIKNRYEALLLAIFSQGGDE